MLKGLFNSSVILVASGFVLIGASSPQESKEMIGEFVSKFATFSAKHRTSFHPNNFTAEYTASPSYSVRQISLVDATDYYGFEPLDMPTEN
ncbi:MAG: hypothetical protein KBB83_01680 [Alphaproteobacteria bacterium]|nr:hypothetical protein [Alphaproteobacteria bacterium]